MLYFASKGYDAFGVDVSKKAMEAASEFALTDFAKQRYKLSMAESGKWTFCSGDFFKDEWCKKADVPLGEWDLIFDYTVSSPKCTQSK